MKISFLLALLSAVAYAIPAPQEGHDHPTTPGTPGMGTPGADTTLPEGFIIEDPINMASPQTPGAKTVAVRTGPYNLKAGATLSTLASNVGKPCQNCFVTAAEADLVFPDGKPANINTGAWLHHMVLYARGGNNKDLVCPSSLLYGSRRRIFATGNERTVARINHAGKFGVQLRAADTFGMIIELMSESAQDQQVFIVMRYEYVEGTAAAGYAESQIAWLDATGCGASSVPAKTGKYSIASPGWKSTLNGKMRFAAGHVHDGGTHADVTLNGKVVCTSKMLYARKPEFISAPGAGGADHHAAALHISDAGACRDFGDIKVGDELKVISYYDMDKYPGQEHEGKAHPIMGIALISITPS